MRRARPRGESAIRKASERIFIDYKTSMITDEDLLRDLLFYQDLGFFSASGGQPFPSEEPPLRASRKGSASRAPKGGARESRVSPDVVSRDQRL